MALVYIGLGSNLGKRKQNLQQAIASIKKINGLTVVATSSVKETEPVDYVEQPLFLNQIIAIETSIEAEKLFPLLQNIEKQMGRIKTIPKGPRIIDLDILLYNDQIIQSKTLTIPHPGITKRPFIMEHLIELNGNATDPKTGKKYSIILQEIS